jgi:hypothetical protein
MRGKIFTVLMMATLFVTLAAVGVGGKEKGSGKDKTLTASENDPTYRLFQLLDTTRGGKLEDFCVTADLYKNPQNPQEEFLRVVRVVYDKDHAFGRLTLHVRSVAKMDPAQMSSYSPKQIYEFAESDMEKYTKTEAGPFGGKGDLYFHVTDIGALTMVPITEEVQRTYEMLLTQYILPALGKK